MSRITVATFIALMTTAVGANGATCGSLSGGVWTNASIWSCGSVPGPADTVVINGGHTIDPAGAQTVLGASFAGGTLSGAGPVTVTGSFSWSSGVLSSTVTLASGATGSITTTGLHMFEVGTLNVQSGATLTWAAGAGDITETNWGPSYINNSGVFEIQNDSSLSSQRIISFINDGVIRKNGGTGASNIFAPLTNNGGTFEIQSGSIYLTGDSTLNGNGTVTGGELVLAAENNTISNGASYSGTGTMRITGGNYPTLKVPGSASVRNVTISCCGNVPGAISGAGTLTVTGTLLWEAGDLASTVTLASGAVGNITTTGSHRFLAATLNISPGATLTWASGAGNITDLNYGTSYINNSGLFLIQNDSTLGSQGFIQVTNNGILRKSGSGGWMIIDSPLTNNSGATIDIVTGNINAYRTTTLNGAGVINGGTIVLNDGTNTIANGASYTGTGTITVAGGTYPALQVPGAAAVANLTLGAGANAPSAIQGAGTLTVTGAFNWVAGSIQTTLALASGTAGTVVTTGVHEVAAGRLNILSGATFTWPAGTSDISTNGLYSAGQINNGGTFAIQFDGTIGSNLTFTNTGLIQKTTATGTTTITSPLNNSGGTIDVRSGAIALTNTFTQNASSHLKVGIGGTSPLTQYGRLSVSGNAPFAGTLTAYSVNSFVPAAGDSFQIMTYGSQTGSFATKNLNVSGKTLVDNVTATALTLVAPPNSAPTANADAFSTNEDTPLVVNAPGVLSNDTDPDNDTLTATQGAGPSNGTLSFNSTGGFTYTPNANYSGSDSFTYTASDGSLTSNSGTVTLTVNTVNDPPVANAQSVSTAEDTPLAITLTGSDPEGQTLTYAVTALPGQGFVNCTGANCTYTPNSNYNGGDNFTFTVTDPGNASSSATVSITVNAQNDAPVAPGQSVQTAEDVPINITLSAFDADGDTLTYAATLQPAYGTVNCSGPNCTYTPNPNYNGPDDFKFEATDPSNASASATIFINVTSVNDAPVANAQSVNTPEDTALAITLSATDADGDTLGYAVTVQPAKGAVNCTGANCTYTPNAGYNGPDSFTFSATDPVNATSSAVISINVGGVNDVPVANGQSVTLNEDTPAAITLSATDADGDTLTYAVTVQPSRGVLTCSGPNCNYTPSANYNGPDSFTFSATDPANTSSSAVVSITVNAINDAPVANAQNASTLEDTARAITLTASDADGDALTYAVTVQPSRGALTCSGANCNYTPSANYNGPDSFTFSATDPANATSSAVVSITVNAVNDAPVANAQTVSVIEDTPKAITLSAADVDGDALTYRIDIQPKYGTLTCNGPNCTYTPNANYRNGDGFFFSVVDANGAASNSALVSIPMTAVNDAPVANAQAVSASAGSSTLITLSGTDVDGDPLIYTVATPPGKGTLSGTPPNLTYTVPSAASGSDSFTFTVNDGAVTSPPATVSIAIAALPVLTARDVSVNESNTTVTFTFTLSAPAATPVTFEYTTAATTATTGSDFAAKSGTATFPSGTTVQIVTIDVLDDSMDEPDETFRVLVSNIQGATSAGASPVATIVDDDPAAVVQFTSAGHRTEAESGTYSLIVQLSNPSAFVVSIHFASDSSSTAGPADFTLSASPLAIAPGALTGSITLTITADDLPEEDESVVVRLTTADNAMIGPAATHSTVISDDDAVPALRISDAAAMEGNQGTTLVTVPVYLSASSPRNVNVYYTTFDRTAAQPPPATASHDYLSVSGTLTFGPGEGLKFIRLSILGDTAFESDEAFGVRISSSDVRVNRASATITIRNDDACPSGTPELLQPAPNHRYETGFMQPTASFVWAVVPHARDYTLFVDGVAHTTTFSTQVVLDPSSLGAGSHRWQVKANYPNCPSSASEERSFIVAVSSFCPDLSLSPFIPVPRITTLAPAVNDRVSSPVTFQWEPKAPPIDYRISVRYEDGQSFLIRNITETSVSVALPAGEARWYVMGMTGSCPRTAWSNSVPFTVAERCDTSAAPPVLLSPAHGKTLPAGPVKFEWTVMPNAIQYRLLISENGAPFQTVASVEGAQASSMVHQFSGGAVVWALEAIYGGCTPKRSAERTLNIVPQERCAGRNAASLQLPQGAVTTSPVTFEWAGVVSADGYRVIATADGSAPVVLGETSGTTLTADLPAADRVVWYVETLFTGCASVSSAPNVFRVARPAACPRQRPALTPPAASEVTGTGGSVRLRWSEEAEVDRYEVWVSLNGGVYTRIVTTKDNSAVVSLSQGRIKWYVVATAPGCLGQVSDSNEFIHTISGCATGAPVHLFPTNGSSIDPLSTRTVTLAWAPLPGVSAYNVRVTAPSFITSTSVTEPRVTIAVPLARYADLHWSVQAVGSARCEYLWSPPSVVWIRTSGTDCAKPTVVAPSLVSSGTEYTLRWLVPTCIEGAYNDSVVQESTSPDFTTVTRLVPTALQGESITVSHTNPGKTAATYYYRVFSSFRYSYSTPIGTVPGSRSGISSTVAVIIAPSVLGPVTVSGKGGAHVVAPVGTQGVVTFDLPLHHAFAGSSFTATSSENWLTVRPSSGVVGTNGATLTLTAAADQLRLGANHVSLRLTFTDSSSRGKIGTHGQTVKNVPISVSLTTPVMPVPRTSPPPGALIIPAVAHAVGVKDAEWRSDLSISNTSALGMRYELNFIPTGDAGISTGKRTFLDIGPGETIALADVVGAWFGQHNASGALEIRNLTDAGASTARNAGTVAASRTYNTSEAGTFGQFIPALPYAHFVGRDDGSVGLQQIAQSEDYRTNLGLIEGSGEPATVAVSVFDTSGRMLSESTIPLAGGQHLQVGAYLATQNVALTDGRIEARVLSGGGKISAYASVLDNVTNDPLLVSPAKLSRAPESKWVVAGVADLANGAAVWRSDLRIHNAGSGPVTASLTLHETGGRASSVRQLLVAPGATSAIDELVPSLFGLINTGGALHVSSDSPSNLVITARTYNATAKGTFGQFVPAINLNEARTAGDHALELMEVEESPRYRTNIGIAEVTGKPATVEISVHRPDGIVTGFVELGLMANEFRQFNSLLRSFGITEAYNARVSIRVVQGEGRVTAYASVIDSATNDPTYVPAQ